MTMRMRFAAVVVMGCCAMGAQTVMAQDASPVPLGQMMSPANAMDELLSAFEGDVMGVAKAMPAEKYGFAPTSGAMAGAKFDGVRTVCAGGDACGFGELLLCFNDQRREAGCGYEGNR